jgi:hypothetical protein
MWLGKLIQNLGFLNNITTPLYCDNMNSFKLIQNTIIQEQTI